MLLAYTDAYGMILNNELSKALVVWGMQFGSGFVRIFVWLVKMICTCLRCLFFAEHVYKQIQL